MPPNSTSARAQHCDPRVLFPTPPRNHRNSHSRTATSTEPLVQGPPLNPLWASVVPRARTSLSPFLFPLLAPGRAEDPTPQLSFLWRFKPVRAWVPVATHQCHPPILLFARHPRQHVGSTLKSGRAERHPEVSTPPPTGGGGIWNRRNLETRNGEIWHNKSLPNFAMAFQNSCQILPAPNFAIPSKRIQHHMLFSTSSCSSFKPCVTQH